ncbi:uncharacterized protein B0I36DRAFT_120611 [Microdochium trichocladiopsis]|uniref:S1-like domain-containing protein n=1 Tax=Microdochium trichocladiopsis TaxID=1682393 RepID=A0A9P9BQT7_9PEZI|nr:uncharacterized protein B0I36DRAFT_120611 [Microdochium trichocladiopsis]KAH7031248.1 hypothetical protein B0I36DRAFT_120611 [Microdochium trichocladiopsis]
MGRPKRDVRAAAEESTTPPDELTAQQCVARVLKAEGNSLYSCVLPDKRTVTVQLQDRFRNTIWIRRGGYVLVDLTPTEEHKGKVTGDIVNIVRDEKEWRKQSYWPKEFAKSTAYAEDSDDEESTVGRMPPSDSESED